jgi:hypothetical protein
VDAAIDGGDDVAHGRGSSSARRPGRGRVEVGRRGTDKAESQEFQGTILIVFSVDGDQWQNSARHGVYSDRFSPPIPGWAVKSEI